MTMRALRACLVCLLLLLSQASIQPGSVSSLLVLRAGGAGIGTASVPVGESSSGSTDSGSSLGGGEAAYGEANGATKRVRAPRLFSLRFVEYFFRRCLSILIGDPDALRIISRILHWTFWSLVGLSVAGTLGIDTKPVLSLLSISLVTLGFAGKDVLVTALDGMLLLVARPFSRGQTVTLQGGHRGVVQEITFKYVRLVNDKKQTVLVPVSQVFNNPIVVEPTSPGKPKRD